MSHAIAVKPIDQLADKTVARIRTVLPGLWAALVGQLVNWFAAQDIITDEVARNWQGLVTVATVTIVTGIAVWLVYALARWVEERQSWPARVLARLLLAVLRQPTYPATDAATPPGLPSPNE